MLLKRFYLYIMRHSFIRVIVLSAVIAASSTAPAFAGPQGSRTKADSLWTAAVDHGRHGRFAESTAIFQDLLDNYRLSDRNRRDALQWMMSNAYISGDYQSWCRYSDLGNGLRKEMRPFVQSLAAQPPQMMERPYADVSIPYAVVSTQRSGNYMGGYILVPVTIGDERTWFFLDNGFAPFSCVSESFAEKHGIRPIGVSREMEGTTGMSEMRVGIADSLRVGWLTVRNLLFAIVPDESLENPVMKIDAILGANFFRLAGEMQFLNRERRILLPLRQEDRPSNLSLNDNDLHFSDVVFRGDRLRFQLDLGANASYLNSRYFRRNKDTIQATYPTDTSRVAGLGGVIEFIVHKVEDPVFEACDGRFTMGSVEIKTTDLNDAPGSFGTLGSDFILSFDKAVLNLRKMYLYVE